MAILWMVAHRGNERLVSGYPGIPEVLSQLAGEVGGLRFGKADPAFEIPQRLGDDLFGPAGHIKARRFGEAQESVPKRGGEEYTGVQDDKGSGRHSASPAFVILTHLCPFGQDYLIVGARFHFRFRHIVDGGMAGGIPAALVIKQVARVDAAVRADPVEWHFAVFEERDQEHARDAQDVGGALGGKLAMFRDN